MAAVPLRLKWAILHTDHFVFNVCPRRNARFRTRQTHLNMSERIAATEVLLISAQSAAAQAAASAAAAAVEAERQLVVENKRRRLARAKADANIGNIIAGIKIAARLGKTDTFFGAIEEDDDFYWDYIAQDLRALGYQVDIQFLEDRRRFHRHKMPLDGEWHSPRQTRFVELIDVDVEAYERFNRDGFNCCGAYERPSVSHRYITDMKAKVADVTVYRCSILEFLWCLTILGPLICGCCDMFGFFAFVCDSSGWRTTCKAPYWKSLCCLDKTSSSNCTLVGVGAIWYVRVSWAPTASSAATIIATALTSTTLHDKAHAFELPIATPIDGIHPIAQFQSPVIRGSLE